MGDLRGATTYRQARARSLSLFYALVRGRMPQGGGGAQSSSVMEVQNEP